MYFDEFGINNEEIIVFLHGANMVHCFAKQYKLAKDYHLVVPHLVGFGNEAKRIYNKKDNITELIDLISKFNKKVNLVCFSLGSQLGFALINERPDLFKKVILVSPWLHKEQTDLDQAIKENSMILEQMKNPLLAKIACIPYGLDRKMKKEFVEYMKYVSDKTIINMVTDMVDFKDYPSYKNLNLNILAICGEKEDELMRDTLDELSNLNKNCISELWLEDFHNIPYKDSKRFNKTILNFLNGEGDYNQCN